MFSFSGLDYAIGGIAGAAATLFWAVRVLALKIKDRPDQWLGDVFNVGTILIIACIIVQPIMGNGPGPMHAVTDEITKAAGANGLVVLAALANCVRVIAGSILNSFSQEKSVG